jgi:hypothetical protein
LKVAAAVEHKANMHITASIHDRGDDVHCYERARCGWSVDIVGQCVVFRAKFLLPRAVLYFPFLSAVPRSVSDLGGLYFVTRRCGRSQN